LDENSLFKAPASGKKPKLGATDTKATVDAVPKMTCWLGIGFGGLRSAPEILG
jgi:hypothetical protein